MVGASSFCWVGPEWLRVSTPLRASDLSALARRLRALKQRVTQCKGGMDYHALEVESLLTFLPSKLTHLYGLE